MAYWHSEPETIRCELCPHRCSIPQGTTGKCRVRTNRGGRLELPFYGAISSIAIDPIEKKPLYHFRPGSRILSIGFVGCNFHCPFCQNYQISQHTSRELAYYSATDVAKQAGRDGSIGVAYTYSEPLVHAEFVIEAAREVRSAGLANVVVTNGFINPIPAAELLDTIDAVNVDLKAFGDGFYREEIGGSAAPVKAFIRQAYEAGVHVEVTTLVIPGKNDSDEEIDSIAGFVGDIDSDIALHLSAYYPSYGYDAEPTPPERIHELVVRARRSLRYVYAGNVAQGDSDTTCPDCGSTVVTRSGYRTEVFATDEGRCGQCGAKLPWIC